MTRSTELLNSASTTVFLTLCVAVFSYAFPLTAQEPIRLSLREALAIGTESNYEVKQAESQRESYTAKKDKTLALFLPAVSVSSSYLKTNDPLSSFGFKLKQRLVTASDFNPVLLNNPETASNFQTKIEIQQPLINPDGWVSRLSLSLLEEMGKKQEERAKNAATFQIKTAYYQLTLAQEALTVARQALKAGEENWKNAKNYREKGIIGNSDEMLAEVRYLEMQNGVESAELNLIDAQESLAYLLGRPNTRYTAVDSLRLLRFETVPLLSELEQKVASRSDLVAYQKGANSAEKMTLMKKFSFIPKINGFGAYEFNDPQLGGFNATNWTLGVSLRWDVFKGFDDVAGIEEAEAEYSKAKTLSEAQLHRAKSDLTAAYKQFETAKRRHELSRKSLEQSSRYLQIIKNRYAQGLEKTADLLNAETTHLQSKLAYFQSIFEQNLALLQLEFFTESTIIKD